MADEVRTALIAAAASIVVGTISGMVTYNTTKTQVQSQIATASLTHAKDIAGAVHDSLDDLFSPDAGRVKTTLAGLYFLGSGQEERQQIVETAGSAGTPQVRAAICEGLGWCGIGLDDARNRAPINPISDPKSLCAIQVLASREDEQIARHTWKLVARS